MNKNVCSACFDDEDLKSLIRAHGGPRGCWACGKKDAPTAPFHMVEDRILQYVHTNYRLAVDHLSYNTREGGYLGLTWDAYDLLSRIGLGLPRDSNGLLHSTICDSLGEEPWCEYDYANLEPRAALLRSWEEFCKTVKHKRRFFFHSAGEDSIDSWTPLSLLTLIADQTEEFGLIHDFPAGMRLYRARPDLKKGKRAQPTNFGPPPVDRALQSNRMNPPGIPLLYAASSVETAISETRATQARLGIWRIESPLRVLDLRKLPPVPGIFSSANRMERHTLSFLHAFANDIMQPVDRTDRVNVDYLPSQVVTEFMRDYPFQEGAIDGIAYSSTVHHAGWNVALFLNEFELGLDAPRYGLPPAVKLRFVIDRWAERAAGRRC